MPRSSYGDDDDEQMFRLPSIRGSPAPRQLGWSGDSFDKLDIDDYPAFMSSDGLALGPGQSMLAIEPPPSGRTPRRPSSAMPSHFADVQSYSPTDEPAPRLSDFRTAVDSSPVNPKTPYDVLGVRSDATQEEIKKAYKKAALRCHPDTCRGGAAEVEQATKRFQLVGEAFAILGDPKRRLEYDQSVRERARARSTAVSKPPKATSFRSTFVPEPRQRAFDLDDDFSFESARDDVRSIDPFYLFNRVFGQAFGQTAAKSTGPYASRSIPAANPSPLDSMSDLASHPMFAAAMNGGRSKPFKMKESHMSAHVNRHGHVNVNRSEHSIKVTKGGGMSFSSSTVSGSFSNRNADMLQQFMSGAGGLFGQQTLDGPSRFPSLTAGRQHSGGSRGGRRRRQSFDSSPSLGSSMQARPGLSHSSSFDDELFGTSTGGWGSSPSGSNQLARYGSSQGVTRKDDWANGW